MCKSSTQLVYVVVSELCAWFTPYNSICKQVACDSFRQKLWSIILYRKLEKRKYHRHTTIHADIPRYYIIWIKCLLRFNRRLEMLRRTEMIIPVALESIWIFNLILRYNYRFLYNNISVYNNICNRMFLLQGSPIGGHIINYLLEKSRVVHQCKGRPKVFNTLFEQSYIT